MALGWVLEAGSVALILFKFKLDQTGPEALLSSAQDLYYFRSACESVRRLNKGCKPRAQVKVIANPIGVNHGQAILVDP